jgi:hypothetical protein
MSRGLMGGKFATLLPHYKYCNFVNSYQYKDKTNGKENTKIYTSDHKYSIYFISV